MLRKQLQIVSRLLLVLMLIGPASAWAMQFQAMESQPSHCEHAGADHAMIQHQDLAQEECMQQPCCDSCESLLSCASHSLVIFTPFATVHREPFLPVLSAHQTETSDSLLISGLFRPPRH